jgi:hypothetical protein
MPLLLLFLAACDPADDAAAPDTVADDTAAGVPSGALDPALFLAEGLAADIRTEACTLSGGTTTTCYRIEVHSLPTEHDVGPFCPRSVTDDARVTGIWIEDGAVFDASGAFIEGLATFYDDDNWQLYDESTGAVNVTASYEACEAAARPDVDPAYQNYCVECSTDYLDAGATSTYLLPVTPVPLAGPAEIDRMGVVGLALNGVDFDPPAPVEAILANYTIAAFDDCGGHVNLHAGYHYHAATGCPTEVAQSDAHAPLIGYALDGYGLYAMLDTAGTEPSDLDACRGHADATRGYHYHVASPGENMFIGCFHGEQGEREGGEGPPP